MANTTRVVTQEAAPFGALLRRLRAAAGLTREEVAARAGLSPAAVVDHPPAVLELRQALRVIDNHIVTSIDRARLPFAA